MNFQERQILHVDLSFSNLQAVSDASYGVPNVKHVDCRSKLDIPIPLNSQ